MVLLGLVLGLLLFIFGIFCVYLWCCRFASSVPQPSDWLERLVPKMSGTLNSAHSLTCHNCPRMLLNMTLKVKVKNETVNETMGMISWKLKL